MKIYFAADHAGFELKGKLIELARRLGHEAEDCGALSLDSADDYPDFIQAAARKLAADAASGLQSRAIISGASGQGEAMVANRFKGVRAALYYGAERAPQTDADGDHLSMIQSVRAHNDANCLSLGARFLSLDEAEAVVRTFLETPFSGKTRHQRRLAKF